MTDATVAAHIRAMWFGFTKFNARAVVLLVAAALASACGDNLPSDGPDLRRAHDGGDVGDGGGNGDGGAPGNPDMNMQCAPSLRECAQAFSWTFTAGTTQPDVVEVRGTFNNWSPGATPMKLVSGAWVATAIIPYGATIEYKFYAKWNDNPDNPLWSTDANNPDIAADGNSELKNIMCATWSCVPETLKLELTAAPTTSSNAYSFTVQVNPADVELDTIKTVVTLNGANATVPYDAMANEFTVAATGVGANKYGYVFKVVATDGRTASLFVPLWIEANAFEWKDAFMYEVMIDRFAAGGTSKAGATGAPTDPIGDWKGGDFGGVTAKINNGYFDAMGVSALWISSPILSTTRCEMGTGVNTGHCLAGYHSYFPIATGWVDGSENDPLFKDHGITNPIDPHFGTSDDLKALVNAAHAHGIRVLTDLVVNHVYSDASPPNAQAADLAPLWLAHSMDASWFNLPYNASVNDCGAENLWDSPTSQTWNRTNCWFNPFLPDFNTSSSIVNDAVSNHAVWLMEEFNLDGFRVDATKQVMNNVCVDLRAKLTAAIGTSLPFYMVGEALGGNVDNVMDCVGADRLDGSMNDPLHNSIVSTFLQGSENGTAFDNDVISDEATWTGRYANALMGHFFGSHDVPRAISQAAGINVGDPYGALPPPQETNANAFKRLTMAQAFLLTYNSLPILWMGDEFGQPGAVDPDNRRMMRFDNALSANEKSTLALMQKIGTARAKHSALRRGTRTRLWVDDTFYAYGRVDGTDIVAVAWNLDPNNSATHAISVDNIGLTGTVTDALSGAQLTVNGTMLTVTLAPLTAAIFTK